MSRVSFITLGLLIFAFECEALPNQAIEINWADLEAFTKSIAEISLHYGSDELARALRDSGAQPDALQKFREQVFTQTNGRPLSIPLPFAAPELLETNRRLQRIGLDFIELVANEEPVVPYHQIPQKDWGQLQHWLRIRKILAPTAAFVTAVTVGIILIRTGNVSPAGFSALGTTPGFYQMLSPFVAGGIGGTLVKMIEIQNLYPYSFRGDTLTYRPFTLWGRFVVRDFAFALVVNALGYFVSAFPTVAVHWASSDKLALFTRAFEAAALSFGSLGLLELAFEKLKARGVLTHMNAIRYETWSMFAMIAGITAFVTSPNWQYGLMAVGGYMSVVSLPIWYKILFGDRIYDWFTKKVLNGTASKIPMVPKLCVRALGLISRVYAFRKN
jgi:hypothetical protein